MSREYQSARPLRQCMTAASADIHGGGLITIEYPSAISPCASQTHQAPLISSCISPSPPARNVGSVVIRRMNGSALPSRPAAAVAAAAAASSLSDRRCFFSMADHFEPPAAAAEEVEDCGWLPSRSERCA